VDEFGKFYSFSLDSNKTSFVLVCINVVLLVVIDMNVRNVIGTNANKSLMNLSR